MNTPRIDAWTLRRLAVDADVDPRTLQKILRGENVRGAAGHRARRVLEREGLLQPLPKKAGDEA